MTINFNELIFADKKDWATLLDKQDRAWLEMWMPEVLELDRNTAISALRTVDIELLQKLTELDGPAFVSSDRLDELFNKREVSSSPKTQEAKTTTPIALPVSPAYHHDFETRAEGQAQSDKEPADKEIAQKKKAPNWKRRSRIAFGIAGIFLCAAFFCVGLLLSIYQNDAHMNPNPKGKTLGIAQVNTDEADIDWPIIDWEYWQAINPDIIGWVTVPGTSINHAICQAHKGDPLHYLQYNAQGTWSYVGIPFLDADCEEEGLNSKVCPIAGHHMTGTDAVFAEFADFNDLSFAKDHSVILLQTPEWNKKLSVQAVSIVPGWERSLRTDFINNDDWRTWYAEQYSQAQTKLADGARNWGNLYLFYTCSYFYNPANERTLVFAMEDK